jgi:hypothetical protein
VAAGLPETTTPWLPTATLGPRRVDGVLVACDQTKGASKRKEMHDIEMILRIRGQLRWNTRRPFARHVFKAITTLLSVIPH